MGLSGAPPFLLLGNEEGLVGEPGGRGSGWHWLLASSCLPDCGESRLKPDNRVQRGDVGLVGPLAQGLGLLALAVHFVLLSPLWTPNWA